MNIIALYLENGRDVIGNLIEETETHYEVEHAEMLVPVETENGIASSMMPLSMLPHKEFIFKKDKVNAVMHHEDVPSELINYFVEKHSGIVIAKSI